jgi:hypothetical protein
MNIPLSLQKKNNTPEEGEGEEEETEQVKRKEVVRKSPVRHRHIHSFE